MKRIKLYEEFSDDTFPVIIFKYKEGDIVRYNGNMRHLFKISEVDKNDFYKPYLLEIIDAPSDANIVGNDYWVKEEELYTDDETELYKVTNKYNL